MQNISQILQKINEVHQRNEQDNLLDVALMIDYTKELYLALLNQEKNILNPQLIQGQALTDVIGKSRIFSALGLSLELPNDFANTFSPQPTDIQEETIVPQLELSEVGGESKIRKENTDSVVENLDETSQIEIKLSAIKDEEVAEIVNEKNLEDEIISNNLYQNNNQEESAEEIDEATTVRSEELNDNYFIDVENETLFEEEDKVPLIVDEIEQNNNEDIPFEITNSLEGEIPFDKITPKVVSLEEMLQLDKSQGSDKDVRNLISVNDQYLFLNELFKNDKREYETVLDTINSFDTFQQSLNWLSSKVAVLNNWEEEDVTVNEFYELLKAFFASK